MTDGARRDGASGRYAVLAPDWALRGYSDRVVLANLRTGEDPALTPTGAYVARSCDGATDFDSPFFLPAHRATLDLMLERGMAVECARGTELDPRQALRRAPNRYLPFANWAVTGRCNLSCRHCYMEAPQARYGELSTEEALRIVGQFAGAGVQRVHLTGGEVFVRADIWEVLGALVAAGIGVHQVSTNGVLLDDEALARLRSLGLDPIIHLSYDGVGAHDGMRGFEGAEGPTLEAVRRAVAAGFRVTVTSSLDRETRDGILAATDVLAQAGVMSWHVSAPIPIGCWTAESTGLPLDEQAGLAAAVLERWEGLGRPFLVTLCGMYSGAPEGYVPPQEPTHRCSPEDMHCGALLNETVYVMPDGRLIPCPRFIDTPLQEAMPSLLDTELSAAWDDEEMRRTLGVSKAQILEHNPECAACAEFGDCGAGCWALAYAATGDFLARDPAACELFRSPYRRRLERLAAAPDPRREERADVC